MGTKATAWNLGVYRLLADISAVTSLNALRRNNCRSQHVLLGVVSWSRNKRPCRRLVTRRNVLHQSSLNVSHLILPPQLLPASSPPPRPLWSVAHRNISAWCIYERASYRVYPGSSVSLSSASCLRSLGVGYFVKWMTSRDCIVLFLSLNVIFSSPLSIYV